MSANQWFSLALYAAVVCISFGIQIGDSVREKRQPTARMILVDLAVSVFWPITLLVAMGMAIEEHNR